MISGHNLKGDTQLISKNELRLERGFNHQERDKFRGVLYKRGKVDICDRKALQGLSGGSLVMHGVKLYEVSSYCVR